MDQKKSQLPPIIPECLQLPTRDIFNISLSCNEAVMIASPADESSDISCDTRVSPNRLPSAKRSDKQGELDLFQSQDTQTCNNRLPRDDPQMITFDDINLDDSSVLEFPHLQLKLKSPVLLSPVTKRQYTKEVVLDPRLLSRPRIEFADIALRGSSPLIMKCPKQDVSEPCTQGSASTLQPFRVTESRLPNDWTLQPAILPESSAQHPVTFETQEMYQEKIHWRHNEGADNFDPLLHREVSSEKQSQKALVTSTGQSVYEPTPPLDCCSDHEPFSHVFRETAPPSDEFLRPNVVAITLEAGPSITRPTKSSIANTALKCLWSIPQKSPHYNFLTAAPGSPLPPPPPYSECTQQSPFKDQKLAHEERLLNSLPQPHISVIPMRDRPDEDPYRLFNPIYGPKIEEMDALDSIGYTNFFHAARVGTRTQQPTRSQFETAAHLRRSEPPKSDHQALAFVSCLFCWPIGLVAIYYSNMCHILKSEGEYERAHIYSRLSFIASMAGLGSGIIAYIIMFVYEKAVYL